MQQTIPTALQSVAGGRDHIDTTEFARAFSKSPKYIRKLHHMDGQAFGIRPVKVGMRLLWPVVEVAKLLNGGAK